MAQEDEVGFGLVGYGAWGGHHAQAIEETPGARLRAVAVPSAASRERARNEHPDTFVTPDYRELLLRDDVDVVDIVVPTHLHRSFALETLRAGKHVLLEKPMARTLEECGELRDAARETGRILAVGHEFRLSSQWGEVQAMIERGEIGDPQYVLVELSRRPYRHGADGWRYDIGRVGNWILEEPIHFFDLARWYLAGAGSPREVFAVANARDPAHPELHDNFTAILRWPGHAYAAVSQTLSAFEHHQTVKVSGTDGAIWSGWSGALDRTERPSFFLRRMRGYGREPEEVAVERPSGELFELRAEIARVSAAARGEAQPAADADDGLWSVGMCLAAQRSVETGQPVDLKRFMAPFLER